MDLFDYAELKTNTERLRQLRTEIEKEIQRVEELKEIGRRNQLQYLRNVEMIDVYVATSMRDDKEYISMAKFVNDVFSSKILEELHLRYFDPTLCYCDSRIDKGIIECLHVRCAKVTIYCAQEGDTFGKDSELAATLCQGKPVIVFVPTGNGDPEVAAELNKRANVFREFHPLSLQVGLYDGVARGVIVVRSAEECAVTLYKIMTNSLQVKESFEENGLVLREKDSNSVIRVMTGWRQLASAFWNNFGLSGYNKSGHPI